MSSAYEPAGYCPTCGYRMDAGMCPECGRKVVRPARRDPRRWMARIRRVGLWLAVVAGTLWALGAGAIAAAYRWWPIASLENLIEDEGRLGDSAFRIREWRLDNEDEHASARWSRIQRDLATAEDHPWAGKYYSSYEGSLRFAISDSGCVYFPWAGCSFSPQSRSFAGHGELVRATETSLFFRESIPEFATSSAAPEEIEYVRIPWGRRHFLIERGELEIMRADGPQSLRVQCVLLVERESDLRFPVDGLPEFPPEYRDLLPPPPIRLPIRETSCEELPPEYNNSRLFRVQSIVTLPDLENPLEPGDGVFAMFADFPESTVVYVSGNEAVIEYTTTVYGDDEPVLPEPGWAFGLEIDAGFVP